MKKGMTVVAVVLITLLLMATPVLAQDPPGMEVDVDIYTPGDADVDIGIDAGGDVSVTIDGTDINEALANVGEHPDGVIGPGDWWRYKALYLDPLFEGLNSGMMLNHQKLGTSMNAIARLIADGKVSQSDIQAINFELAKMSAANREFQVASVQRDDEIWNQLMYGAEAHLAILNGVVDGQAVTITALRQQVDNQAAYIDALRQTMDANNASFHGQLEYLRVQYMYYLWIVAGGALVLLALAVIALRRKAY